MRAFGVGGSIPAVTPPTPHLPDGCAPVTEEPVPGLPALSHPGWARRFPWLMQGTTTRGAGLRPFDLGLFSDASPPRDVLAAWEELRRWSGSGRVVHAHQVHEATVRVHATGPAGLHVAEACDGHATGAAGVLLAVTTADCVPVFVVAPEARAVALLHAGWRGVAAGILERGLAALAEGADAGAEALHVHLGPAICGDCYEVGPEVFRGLGLEPPDGPALLDLRAVLARRALDAGVLAGRVTASTHCTKCGDAGLFSHRGGDRQRQVGFLGIRP